MGKPRLVVVGNGMAGMRCVEHICDLAPDMYEITVFGNEPHPNYNRIMLSKVLQGGTSVDDITIHDWNWYKERGISLHTGETVLRADPGQQRIYTASGHVKPYDRLIIATGSAAFLPKIPGIHKPGVTAFRNIADCERMMEASRTYKHAAVIGGGLLGLEAARGLLNLGMEVDVIHNASYLMNRQLDTAAAEMLKRELTQQGMRFLVEKRTERIFGRKRAEGLQFSDGRRLGADLIVLAVGIRPNISVAEASGIPTNRAIIVDDYMQTGVDRIYAVGECAEHRGIVYGLVAPLYEQARVLAMHLCGQNTEPYPGSVPYAQLKVSGVEVFSAGLIQGGECETALQHYDGVKGTYKKVTMKNGRIAGAVLFGDSSEGTELLGYLKRQAPVSALKAQPTGGCSSMAKTAEAMGDQETVCNCNSVTKAAIMETVWQDGARTVEQIRERTKASGSCGGCRPMVAAILELATSLGAMKPAPAAAPVPICGCTELDRAAIRAALSRGSDASVQAAMLRLGWKRPEGCPVCRSTSAYYLGIHRPGGGGEPMIRVSSSPSASPGGLHPETGRIALELKRRSTGWIMPGQIRIAVSAGPRDPAGVLVHDLGIGASPAGWELYAGGHMEHPVKEGQLVGALPDAGDIIDMALSCLALYRDSAYYREPVWEWLERYGLQRLREKLLDPDERDSVLETMDMARSAEIDANSDTHSEERTVGI
ncbi:nitrite reductase large subunit NirB [Paenibacillus sp. XY044]|uniref:nitrite reductase large subunit NirB n=1 Tax=Paenibacillus sp. XY044 TaxID=2026089 RepID=UPI000B996D1C|nr:nitrite reductase large subunit NirB [Paenibacillus sp. XY044]OZB95282.1 nitrite reductase [Paenibacillus sp. XY044]